MKSGSGMDMEQNESSQPNSDDQTNLLSILPALEKKAKELERMNDRENAYKMRRYIMRTISEHNRNDAKLLTNDDSTTNKQAEKDPIKGIKP
jgi:hypothetical protein